MRSTNVPLSFETLLGAMLLLLFVPALVGTEWVSLMSRSLYTIVMLASLYLVSTNRKSLITGIILFIPVMITRWGLTPFLDVPMQLLGYCIFQVIFLAYVVHIMYNFLLSAKIVDTEIIYASIILYIVFGLCMSLVYYATLVVAPGALGESLVLDFSSPVSLTVVLHDLIYFSFVTQTTLGYGDISPTTGFTKALASTQAMVGQIYVAVIIARLVGIQIATTLDDRRS